MQPEPESGVDPRREFAADPPDPDAPGAARERDAEVMLQRIAQRLLGEPARAVLIGRFPVIDTLGEGGMGVVYLAEDTRLHRQVAIKAIRGDRLRVHPGERARLLREARALAQLSHPNVVQVHEVHEDGPEVFVVMELVRGMTLGKWLETPRTLPQILQLFVQAGRGLDAAHGAGIIHRDFKPSNALVGLDGRVRIVDFGLARGDPTPADTTSPAFPRTDGSAETTLVTMAQAGTPAYMSPEQIRGLPCDARSDQFSFCVALYEAVYGKRPFAPGELAARIEARETAPPELGSDAPRWLRSALARGLALRPEDRHRSMAALLAILDETPKRRRRAAWAACAGVTLVGAAITGALMRPPVQCAAAGARMHEIWGDPQRAAITRTFGETGLSYAKRASTRVIAALDTYSAGWVEVQREACEATRIRGELSDMALDQSTRCLDRASRALVTLANVLVDATPAVVGEAEALVAALPSPAACRESEPGEPLKITAPSENHALEEMLDRARILEGTHQATAAVQLLEQLVARSQAPADRGFEAEALLLLGRTQAQQLRDPQRAQATLHRALDVATLAHRDDLVWAIWSALSRVLDHELEEHARARTALEHARTALSRTGDPEAELALMSLEGVLLAGEGRHAEAIEKRREVLRRVEARPDAPAIRQIEARNAVATALAVANDTAEARRLHQALWDDTRAQFGEDHPLTASVEMSLGLDHFELEELPAAQTHLTHARTALAAAYGAASPSVATVDLELARIEGAAGELEAAIARARDALAVFEEHFPPTHGDREATLTTLSELYRATGDYAGQLEVSLALLAFYDARPAREGDDLEGALTNVGESLCDLKRCGEALPYFSRLMNLYLTRPPEEPGMTAIPAFGYGRAYLARGKLELALPFLEDAYLTFQTYPIERDGREIMLAAMARSLADALAGLRQDPQRVRRLRTMATDLEQVAAEAEAAEPGPAD